jgi:hypothetical protein
MLTKQIDDLKKKNEKLKIENRNFDRLKQKLQSDINIALARSDDFERKFTFINDLYLKTEQ